MIPHIIINIMARLNSDSFNSHSIYLTLFIRTRTFSLQKESRCKVNLQVFF